MNMLLRIFAVSILSLGASVFLNIGLLAQSTSTPSERRTAENVVSGSTIKVIQIDEVTIKELLKPKGKPLLVNFWATWCIPCREEFPDLVELDKEYKGKIDFITISLDDLAEIERDVPKFLSEMKATMPAYLLRTTDENAVISLISKDWHGGLPFTILYAATGDIAYARQGKITLEVVKSKIDDLRTKDESRFAGTTQITQLPVGKIISIHPKRKYNFEKGLEDAKKDVASGKYVIMRYGFGPGVSPRTKENVKSKKNIEIRNFGCSVSTNLIQYINGYNKISKAAINSKFGIEY